MWQDLIVYAAVVLALAWVGWTYLLPAALRNRLRRRNAAAGCGRCSGCGGEGGCH